MLRHTLLRNRHARLLEVADRPGEARTMCGRWVVTVDALYAEGDQCIACRMRQYEAHLAIDWLVADVRAERRERRGRRLVA